MVDLYSREVGSPRRAGSAWVGLCPFHEERSGSFSMRMARDGWRGHCFGCGWDGSVFDLVMGLRGCDFAGAVEVLGGMLGLPREAVPRISSGGVVRRPREAEVRRKPWLPRLEVPTAAELEQLAGLRGLQVAGLKAAVGTGVLWATDWPWRWDGTARRHVRAADAVRSWVVTDDSRWTAQYRRLDGGLYEIGGDGGEARRSKSWSTRNVAWPVGCGNLGSVGRVVLVEGSPDVLAAFHFLRGWGLLGSVGVCGVLGASNRLAEEAMGCFKDREVRIFAHADVARDGRRSGWEGGLRWQSQLAEAGASVSVANLEGLVRRSGERVKDVNDLAWCDPEVLEEVVRPLFAEWGL